VVDYDTGLANHDAPEYQDVIIGRFCAAEDCANDEDVMMTITRTYMTGIIRKTVPGANWSLWGFDAAVLAITPIGCGAWII
jgi:hypothetical protein